MTADVGRAALTPADHTQIVAEVLKHRSSIAIPIGLKSDYIAHSSESGRAALAAVIGTPEIGGETKGKLQTVLDVLPPPPPPAAQALIDRVAKKLALAKNIAEMVSILKQLKAEPEVLAMQGLLTGIDVAQEILTDGVDFYAGYGGLVGPHSAPGAGNLGGGDLGKAARDTATADAVGAVAGAAGAAATGSGAAAGAVAGAVSASVTQMLM